MLNAMRLSSLAGLLLLTGCQHPQQSFNIQDPCGATTPVTVSAPAQKYLACVSLASSDGAVFSGSAHLTTAGDEVKLPGTITGAVKADIQAVLSANGSSGQAVLTVTSVDASKPLPTGSGDQAPSDRKHIVLTIAAVADGKPVSATVTLLSDDGAVLPSVMILDAPKALSTGSGDQAPSGPSQTAITLTAAPDGMPVRTTVNGYKGTLRLVPIAG